MPKPDDQNVIRRPMVLPPVRDQDDWREWPAQAKMEYLAHLESLIESRKPLSYWTEARPKQLPPNHGRHHLPDENGFACGCSGGDDDWSVWLLCAGRGIGKTYTGSNWILSQALNTVGEYAVLAPTHADVKRTCIERAILPKLRAAKIKFHWNKSELQITLPNGSMINGYTADNPERIRGSNLSGAWCIAKGELVGTGRGEIPIEDVQPGDSVMTRRGWRTVLRAGLTKHAASLVEIRHADGALLCTPDHVVWTENRGWCRADEMTPCDALIAWNSRTDLLNGSTGQTLAGSCREEHVNRRVSVIAVGKIEKIADVYDLTIDGDHEFFASGVLVHNCDEIGSWRYSSTWYEGLIPALRIGRHPRIVATTTPRPTDLMFDLIKRDDGSVHLTSGSTFENVANLSPVALAEMKRRYDGTRIGLQELYGQLLEDIVGALWTREMIESARIGKRLVKGEWHDDLDDITLTRIIVGVDPAVTSNEHSDETGIVVVGMDVGGHAYVIDDGSGKRTPRASLVEAIKAYRKWGAEGVVVEVNNGGDYIPELMATIDANVPVKVVRATRGKIIRAEPVASLYEQGRVHHYGFWEKLEEQMCSYVPAGKRKASPDRMDALVWAITALKNLEIGDFHSAYGTRNCQHCGKGYIEANHPNMCPFCKRRQL